MQIRMKNISHGVSRLQSLYAIKTSQFICCIQPLTFWEIRGQKIEGIIPDAPSGICNVAHIPDTIIIRRAPRDKLKMGQLAVTERRSDLQNNMISSVIWFDDRRLNEPWIIEHEIGHGLGYAHVNVKNHVMNPWAPSMGPEFWIP